MKRRTTSFLRVRINKLANADIESIEFLFRQERDEDSTPSLLKAYPSDVRYDKLGDRYMIGFTEEETALFLEDHEFFMDTRIKLKSGYIPQTSMTRLWMCGTLFDNSMDTEYNPFETGKSPYIGENSHWFCYNDDTEEWEDTGVVAVGRDGTDAVIYTLEPSNPLIVYDPNALRVFPYKANYPVSVSLTAYRYRNGVKEAYTPDTIVARVTYMTFDQGASMVQKTATESPTLSFPTNEENGWVTVEASYMDPNGNEIKCTIPYAKCGEDGDTAEAVWYTLEPSAPIILYNPDLTANSPASITLSAYKYVNGVKSAYQAALITAVITYAEPRPTPATVTKTAANASSLIFPITQYGARASVVAYFDDEKGNRITCTIPSVKQASGVTPFPTINNTDATLEPNSMINVARTYPDSMPTPSVGDYAFTKAGVLLKVSEVTSTYIEYDVIANLNLVQHRS